ncbi:hypothetical protein BGX28_010051, partial [Mortierella sp. GBA30]
MIYWPTQICMGGTVLVALIGLAVVGRDHNPASAAVFGYSALIVAWTVAVLLNYYEHLYSIRSSDFIFAFYLLVIPILLIHARTLSFVSHTPTSTVISTLEKITESMITLLMFGFIVEAWPRGSTKVQRSSVASKQQKANLFSRATYYFYQPVISLSVQKTLTLEDTANVLPAFMKAENAHTRLERYWNRTLQKTKSMSEDGNRCGGGHR